MDYVQIYPQDDGRAIAGHDPVRNGAAALISGLFGGMGAYARKWRDYRRLEELPDYLLDDIGLTRAEVAAAARRSL